MKPSIVYITAGESPSLTNVSSSQVLYVLAELVKQGYSCRLAIVLPWKDLLKRPQRESLVAFRKQCEEFGVELVHIYFGGLLFSPRMLRVRKPYSRLVAGMLLKRLDLDGPDAAGQTILTGRSYFATNIAIEMRRRIPSRNLRVAFDMRGLLSLTFPSSARRGRYRIYGDVKAWEAEMAEESDVIFNNRRKAIDLFEVEYGREVTYLPVSGFASSRVSPEEFEVRWEKKIVAFVGNLHPKFHDPALLNKIFVRLAENGFHPMLVASKGHEACPSAEQVSIDFHEMEDFYRQCTAVIIPGRTDFDDVFDRWAQRIYTAPTKMSEAFTCGVPIIVGDGFEEIADFVTSEKCGFVWNSTEGRQVGISDEDLASKDFWWSLSCRAAEVGEGFSRSRVVQIYRESWDAAFSKPGRLDS